MDEIDEAQIVNELHQRISLEAQRAKAHPQPPEDFDGTHCIHCQENVEFERLKHGYFTCYECQSFIERYGRNP